jgi:serine/threonine protein kinase
MLTSRKPFVGASAIEVLQQHVHADVPRLPPDLAQLQPLVDRMLAKARTARFQSADELIEALAKPEEEARLLVAQATGH